MSPSKKLPHVNWFDMDEIPYRASRLLKALGNPKTYALLRLLLDEEVLGVEDMARRLNRTTWNVSKILRPLRDLEIVRYQRVGRRSLYTLKDRKGMRRVLDAAEEYARRASERA